MPNIQQDLNQIRRAVYGKDVREAIAHGIESCYDDISSGRTIAIDAAEAANSAADRANAIIAAATAAAERADGAADNVAATKQDILDALDAEGEEIEDDLDDKIVAVKALHDNDIAFLENALAEANQQVAAMQEKLAGAVTGLENDNGTLYGLNENGERVTDGITGIGGGGAVSTSEMNMSNGMEWAATTIRHGASLPITVSWSSTQDNIPTGNGVLKLYVGGILKKVLNVAQGSVTVNVGEYLAPGQNNVRITITDAYDNTRFRSYTVTSVQLTLSSSFAYNDVYTGAFNFPFTPVGAVEKTVHFRLDGTELETLVTSISNRQLNKAIPAQSHGGHSLEVWYTASINGETVESNRLYYEFIALESGNNTPIIVSNFRPEAIQQYDTVQIPFRVYSPAAMTVETTISENNVVKATATYDRQYHSYTFNADASGQTAITITVGSVNKTITVSVTALDIPVQAETEGLELYLDAKGRSNNELNPASWTSGMVSASFTGMNWVSNGWISDNDGVTAMRLSGLGRITIPFQPFATDKRAEGFTFEVEFATRNVRDYDATVLSCVSGGRGIVMTAQEASFASEQASISTQYKEDEHIRVSFVAMKSSEKRLLIMYANGVLSGVVEYPANDDFSQVTPVGISLGSSDCDLDIYSIRYYNHDLNRFQILDNFISDAASGREKLNRYNRNNVYDEYGNIVIAKLPANLPYLVITGALPQYKGNKLTVSGYYVDPTNPEKSFSFEGATIDVQGTSSQYYPRKNYKIKFSNGFIMTLSGETASKYAMSATSIPTKTFTFKADFASSEGANNTVLAGLYNANCPYKTPYQVENPYIRQGIEGHPCIIFHNDGENVSFIGKYNFNNDKGTAEVFGFREGDESWEIKNNTSDRVLWKSDDYSGSAWQNDFEARYPEDSVDKTRLQALATWLKSTDQSAATGDALPESVSYTDTVDGEDVTATYTNDTAAYRLAKFKHELPIKMEVQSAIYYYLFTLRYLMVDSRAKNAFPSIMGGSKWMWLPYDFDTALGINNEGALAFGYWLEDIDQTASHADIFNGQNSVLWVNLRQAFWKEIQAMYQNQRSLGHFGYDELDEAFTGHQSIWSEAIVNEDSWYKYIDPNEPLYYPDAQGLKTLQRQWWDYNRSRYMDSMMNAGDALTDVIQVRGYAKADITVTPYAWVYASVKYGSYLVQQRAQKAQQVTLTNPLDNVNDTEIYIYSASQLSSIGDISGLKPGLLDVSKAVNLTELIAGSTASGYQNGNAFNPTFGNNRLLKKVDCRNITGLTSAVDMSGCTGLEEAYFDGTNTTGVTLPNGGVLKKLHLPASVTNLTILNQPGITELVATASNLTTLRIENCPTVDTKTLLNSTPANARVRLIGIAWEATDAAEIEALLDKLDTMRGLDENGNNMDSAQVSGTIHTSSLTGAQISSYNSRYPYVTVTADHTSAVLTYKTFDGSSVIDTETVMDGGNGTKVNSTARTATAQYTFAPDGWSLTQNGSKNANALTAVTADRTVYAAYTSTLRTYTATFVKASEDGGGTLYTQSNIPYGTTPTYGGSTPSTTKGSATDYPFQGWSPALVGITGNTTYTAVFGSPKEVAEITDSWDTIFAALDDGTYATKYKVGNYKAINLGTEGSGNVSIVAKDVDECANGSGTAPLSMVITFCLNADHRMNPSKVANTEGTGTLGGWDKSEMKSYLLNTIWPLIPQAVRDRIVPVKKYTKIYQASDETAVNNVETTETIYLLSNREVRFNGDETSGPDYATFFSSTSSRIMYKNGTAQTWWLRSAGTATNFRRVNGNGSQSSNSANGGDGVVLGFCFGTSLQLKVKSGGLTALSSALSDGTYSTKYAPGDLIAIDNDGENSANYIQVLALDNNADELADGSGNHAKMACCFYYALPTNKRMNPYRVSNTEGTGSLGGWDKTEMKAYLTGTLWNNLPTELKNLIVPVKKYTRIYQASDETAVNNVETTETVYLLSDREVFGSSGLETSGPAYTSVFNDNNARKKKRRTNSSYQYWWLRSAYFAARFRIVGSSGFQNYSNASDSICVVLGFNLDIQQS